MLGRLRFLLFLGLDVLLDGFREGEGKHLAIRLGNGFQCLVVFLGESNDNEHEPIMHGLCVFVKRNFWAASLSAFVSRWRLYRNGRRVAFRSTHTVLHPAFWKRLYPLRISSEYLAACISVLSSYSSVIMATGRNAEKSRPQRTW